MMYPELYKRDSKGQVRVWLMETDGNKYRTISGLKNGKRVDSGWTVVEGKNIGKVNETSPSAQAEAEVLAEYKKKKRAGYFLSETDIDKAVITKPMLATDWTKRKSKVDVSKGVFLQPKLDGIRNIARKDGMWSRTGVEITSIPHIREALEPFFGSDPDLILDGELYNHDLREDFNSITSIVRKTKPTPEDIQKSKEVMQYHIYDIPSMKGNFNQRNQRLIEMFSMHETPIKLVPTVLVQTEEEMDELYALYIEYGYEGCMVRLNEPYQNKRSNSLMKWKDFISEEFEVVDIHEGVGNWAGYVKAFSVRLTEGQICGTGVRGSQESLRELLVGSKKAPEWATVRYFGKTPDGMLRFPVVTDWGWGERED